MLTTSTKLVRYNSIQPNDNKYFSILLRCEVEGFYCPTQQTVQNILHQNVFGYYL